MQTPKFIKIKPLESALLDLQWAYNLKWKQNWSSSNIYQMIWRKSSNIVKTKFKMCMMKSKFVSFFISFCMFVCLLLVCCLFVACLFFYNLNNNTTKHQELDYLKKPYLKCMGANIVHCGDIGNGQVAKLCNNPVLGIGGRRLIE
jgi:hypothetical protein